MDRRAVNLRLDLPPELLDEIAAEVTRRVLAEIGSPPAARWLTGAKAAADYLGCSERRIYNRLHEIPHAKDGGRLMFNTADLDDHVRNGRSTT